MKIPDFFPDMETLLNAAAENLAVRIQDIVNEKDECSVILSGGNTPRKCYERLGILLSESRDCRLLVSRVHWFLGDERYVKKHDAERNEKMISESLFSVFTPSPETVHFWEEPPATPALCAALYDRMLGDFFHRKSPDIALMGLGSDGHTASLFPDALIENQIGARVPLSQTIRAKACAVYIPEKDIYRLSMSASFFKRSGEIVFIAGGKEKAPAFSKLLRGDSSVPSAWIAGDTTRFFVTEDIKS